MFQDLARRLRADLLPHIETFARFLAGFLASEHFHRISMIYICFWDFHDAHRFMLFSDMFTHFHRFAVMFVSIIFCFFCGGVCISEYGCLTTVKLGPEPLLDSRLASGHLRTFIVFHGFPEIFVDFNGLLAGSLLG